MRPANRMATCAMMTALTVVLMLLGAVLELGMYAAPMLAGLCLIPTGRKFGCKYHTMLWIAASVLCFLLVPNVEENLMFAGLFGWYPIIWPLLQKQPKLLRLAVKLLVFNTAIIAIEALVMLVFLPEELETGMLIVLLLLGNITFLLYDHLIPQVDILLKKIRRSTM